MALISKEDLLTKFETGALLFQPEVKRIIKIQPEVDAVEVVRCRDCKWWNDYYRECESPNWNTGTDEYIVQPAGMFCGWGERKSEEDPSHPCADSVMMGD